MEFEEKNRILRRINNRKILTVIHYQNEDINVLFNDPTLDIKCECDSYIQKYIEEAKDLNLPTIEETYKILKEQKIWSDTLENELKLSIEDKKTFTEQLGSVKFKKAQERILKSTIEKLGKRINELEDIKNQLSDVSSESYIRKRYNRQLMTKIATLPKNMENLLQNPSFLDDLSVLYNYKNSISQKEIREIARTNPWRLYWIVAKETGTPLFNHSLLEMTDYQYILLNWSKIYDFAYQSENRPSDDVINDDLKFDDWYEQESRRIDKETKSQEINKLGNIGAEEVFIPADIEGAKEVYDLNSEMGRKRLNKRQEMILEKGSVNQIDLPDVKSDLKMEANRLMNQSIKNR